VAKGSGRKEAHEAVPVSGHIFFFSQKKLTPQETAFFNFFGEKSGLGNATWKNADCVILGFRHDDSF
jgi:hypothetical protein